MAAPTPRPGPDRDPSDPSGFDEAERARAVRTLSRRLQAGGIAFLAVVSLGLVPPVLAAVFPSLGRSASIAAWVLAPVVPLALLVVAALRLRR